MTTLTEANVEQAALSPVHPPTERLCTTTAARPDRLERAALIVYDGLQETGRGSVNWRGQGPAGAPFSCPS